MLQQQLQEVEGPPGQIEREDKRLGFFPGPHVQRASGSYEELT